MLLSIQVAFGILLNVAGQLLMKRAAMGAGLTDGAAQRAILSGWFVAGGATLGLSMLVWVQVLRKLPLTVAHPLTGAIFVMVPVASHFLWDEPLNGKRLLGILVVAFGIVLVARAGT